MKKLLLLALTCILSIGLFAQISTEDSQILYLDFEDDTDLALNDEGIDLLDDADLSAEEGRFGGAVSFNGTSSFMVMELIPDWNHGMDWSLSFWIKSAVVEQFVWGILGFCTYSGSPEGDYYDDEPRVGGLTLGVPDPEFVGKLIANISWVSDAGPWDDEVPAVWDDGDWHNFVITYSTETEMMNMYIDNMPYIAEPSEMAIAADLAVIIEEEGFTEASIEDDNLKLGTAGIGWGVGEGEEYPDNMYFNGAMDDLRLFNVALTEEEVAEIFNYNPTGLTEYAANLQFSILPNPASQYIMIKSTTTRDIEIFNTVGQMVLIEKSVQDGNTINIANLSKGLYFVKSGDATQKLIIE